MALHLLAFPALILVVTILGAGSLAWWLCLFVGALFALSQVGRLYLRELRCEICARTARRRGPRFRV